MTNIPKINSAIESDHALLEIINGVESKCVCINSYRVCGNKPWGGGSLLYSFSIPKSDILKSLDVNLPALMEKIKVLAEAVNISNSDAHFISADWLEEKGHKDAANAILNIRKVCSESLEKFKTL